MARKPRTGKVRGAASRALKEMRERAEQMERGRVAEARRRGEDMAGRPPLTQRQMALECEPPFESTSKYQYYEDDLAKEYMDITLVRRVMPPLVNRGISEKEVMSRLLGTPGVKVVFAPREPGRRVPVLSRNAVGLIARGDLDITSIGKLPADDLGQWKAAGVILDWEYLSGAGEGSVYFDLADGTGRVAVDSNDRDLVEGKSYVFCDLLDEFNYATWRGGAMVAAEGEARGSEVPFNPGHDYVVGRVVWEMQRR